MIYEVNGGGVYRIDPSGAVSTVYAVAISLALAHPYGHLIELPDGGLAGLVHAGILVLPRSSKLTPTGQRSTFHTFAEGVVNDPSVSPGRRRLLRHGAGTFTSVNGEVFRVDPASVETTLHAILGPGLRRGLASGRARRRPLRRALGHHPERRRGRRGDSLQDRCDGHLLDSEQLRLRRQSRQLSVPASRLLAGWELLQPRARGLLPGRRPGRHHEAPRVHRPGEQLSGLSPHAGLGRELLRIDGALQRSALLHVVPDGLRGQPDAPPHVSRRSVRDGPDRSCGQQHLRHHARQSLREFSLRLRQHLPNGFRERRDDGVCLRRRLRRPRVAIGPGPRSVRRKFLRGRRRRPGRKRRHLIAIVSAGQPPLLASLEPPHGRAAGGAAVTARGSHFRGAGLSFGGLPGIYSLDPDQATLTWLAPALPAGTLNDVTVTNQDATSATLAAGWFADFLDVAGDTSSTTTSRRSFANGITAGCGGGNYCPTRPVTRAQMAVFLLKAKHGATTSRRPARAVFADVPCPGAVRAPGSSSSPPRASPAAAADGNYCPSNPVTRAQMAVFLLKPSTAPATCRPPARGVFDDVAVPVPRSPTGSSSSPPRASPPAAAPASTARQTPNTRAQMAVFLSKTFSLP